MGPPHVPDSPTPSAHAEGGAASPSWGLLCQAGLGTVILTFILVPRGPPQRGQSGVIHPGNPIPQQPTPARDATHPSEPRTQLQATSEPAPGKTRATKRCPRVDGTCAHPSLPSTSPGCSTLPGLEAAFIQPVTASPRWSPSRSHSTQRSPQLARSHRAGKNSYSPLIPGARNKLRGLERAAEAHAGRAGRSRALTPVAQCSVRRTLPRMAAGSTSRCRFLPLPG